MERDGIDINMNIEGRLGSAEEQIENKSNKYLILENIQSNVFHT